MSSNVESLLIPGDLVEALRAIPRNEVQRKFSAIDSNGDGYVNAAGLRDVLAMLGTPAGNNLPVLADLFTLPNGLISIDEFVDWASDYDAVTAHASAPVASLINRVRGALMGAGPRALEELFKPHSSHTVSPGAPPPQLVDLSAPQLLARLQGDLGLSDLREADVHAVLRAMDRNSDGAASHGEMARFLDQKAFSGRISRILTRGAQALRRLPPPRQPTTLHREIVAMTAASRASAAVAGDPLPPPAADGSPVLPFGVLRYLLLTRLGFPLKSAQIAAIGQCADLDGNGTADAGELLFLAGEGTWAAADLASPRAQGGQGQQQWDAQPRQATQQGHAPWLGQGQPWQQQQQVQQYHRRPTLPVGPLAQYCDLVPEGVEVIDDLWDAPPEEQMPPRYDSYGQLLPAFSAPSAVVSLAEWGAQRRRGGLQPDDEYAAPFPLVPRSGYAAPRFVASTPHSALPSPHDLYPLPLPPALAACLYAPHDLAAAALTAAQLPLPGFLQHSPDVPHPLPEHDGCVSTPLCWPGVVEHCFLCFASEGAAAAPPGGPPGQALQQQQQLTQGQQQQLTQGQQGPQHPGSVHPAAAPGGPQVQQPLAPPAAGPSGAPLLDATALGPALAALGLPRPGYMCTALATRHASAPAAAFPGAPPRLTLADFTRIVDEVHCGGGGGLHTLAAARLARALAAAGTGARTPPCLPDAADPAASEQLSRAQVATAFMAACGDAAGLTEAEAASIAAWAPGPGQADALAAVAFARLRALVEGAALAAQFTSAGLPPPPPAPSYESSRRWAPDELPLAEATPAQQQLLQRLVDSAAAAPDDTTQSTSQQTRALMLPRAAAEAAASGRFSQSASCVAALASACPSADVNVGALMTWLSQLALGGGGAHVLHQQQQASPTPAQVPLLPPATAAAAAAAAGTTHPHHVASGEHPSVAAAAAVSAGAPPRAGPASPPSPLPAPPPAAAALLAVLDPLTRHALRKALGPLMALPVLGGGGGVLPGVLRLYSLPGPLYVLPPPPQQQPQQQSRRDGSLTDRQQQSQQVGATLPVGCGVPGAGHSPAVLATAFTQLHAGHAAASVAAGGPLARVGGAAAASPAFFQPPALPLSFHPSRLAALAAAGPAELTLAAGISGGLEADPGGLLAAGAAASAVTGAPPDAAAGNDTLLLPELQAQVARSQQQLQQLAGRGGTGGAGDGSLLPLPSALAPSPQLSGAELASRHAQVAGRGQDGLGLSLRLSTVLPGSLDPAHAAAAAAGGAAGCCVPTQSSVAAAAIAGSGGGAQAAFPVGHPAATLPLRLVGGAATVTDGGWAFEGALVRPAGVATAVVQVLRAENIPCPASDASRRCIVGRVLRVALVDLAPPPDATTPPRMRVLSNSVTLAAGWSLQEEDVWTFGGTGGAAASAAAAAAAASLVLRCDHPRHHHQAAAAAARGAGGAAVAGGAGGALLQSPLVPMLLVELNAILAPPSHGPGGPSGGAPTPGSAPAGTTLLLRQSAGGSPGAGVTSGVVPIMQSQAAAVGALVAHAAQQQQGSGVPVAVAAAPLRPSDGASGWGEEVTCAWGTVPLAQLAAASGSASSEKHVVRLTGGSPCAQVDISPADILRRRAGVCLPLFGGGGASVAAAGAFPTLTLSSASLASLGVAARQALARLPLCTVLPLQLAAATEAWRTALASTALRSPPARSHLDADSGSEVVGDASGAAPALAVAAAVAAAAGALGESGGGVGGGFSALAAALDVELRAHHAHTAAAGGQPTASGAALIDVLVRAWPGTAAASAALAPRLATTGSGAQLGLGAPRPPPQQQLQQRGGGGGRVPAPPLASVPAGALIAACSPATAAVLAPPPSALAAALAAAAASPHGHALAFNSATDAALHRPFAVADLAVAI